MPPVRRPRRLTGRFALGVLGGFVLSQLALGVAIDRRLPSARDPQVEAKLEQLLARRAEAPDRPLVVVLGSSRVAYGLDAASLSRGQAADARVFNFGISGSGPFLNLVNLRWLLREGIRPDLLYVEVLLPLLTDSNGPLEEKMVEVSRLRLEEVLKLRRYYCDRWRLLNGWCLARALPCYRHRAWLHKDLGTETPPDAYGWRSQASVTDKFHREMSGLAQRQYGAHCTAATLAAGPLRALEDLLALCRREHIPVRLLLMPEGKPFRDLYAPPTRQAISACLEGLRARWGVGVVDAREWVEDAGFSDSHHLLAHGARCFTRRFGREAVAPALRELRR